MKLTIVGLVSVAFVSSIALADDFPLRKPGLWEINTAGQISKQCTDEGTDKKMMKIGETMAKSGGVSCTKNTMTKQGAEYVAESECQMMGIKVTSRSIFAGDFNSSYTVKTSAKYDPPMTGMPSGDTTITAQWVGPCSEGLVPGDLLMPGGVKINLNDPMPQMPKLTQ